MPSFTSENRVRVGVNIILVSALSFGFMACSGNSPQDVVVSYKEKSLTRTQLQAFMPQGLNPADSARFAEQAIEEWIMDQAVMDEALSRDDSMAERVAAKVEDYRAELIKHEFHNQLIKDSLDLAVDEAEIIAYHERSKQDFISADNRYCYFYCSSTQDNLREQEDWMKSNDYKDILKLREWARQNAIGFKVDSSYASESAVAEISKGYLGDLRNVSPGKFIQWTGVIEGERRRYLFKMIDVLEKGEPLPLQLCRNKIENLILNERKNGIIQRADNRILDNAKANNYVTRN